MILLLIVMVRFNARANPTPSRTTHNTLIEVVWTVAPVIILVAIAVPSFRLLFVQLDIPQADLTVKATGKQWYWSYDYPDNGNFEFDSLIVEDKDLKPGQPRLLTVDNEMVVPVNKVVRVLVTGADVIHSFAVPSFGIKIDAVPGRLNETWFKATSRGTLLRPMLRTVRQGSRLHADRGAGGERRRVRRLGRGRRRRTPASTARPPTTLRGGRPATQDERDALIGNEDRQWIRWHTRQPTATITDTPSRTAGAATSIRRTTRTSARCTWCSRSSPA